MAISERMQAHVDRIRAEDQAAGRPSRLTPEQQEEAITNANMDERYKKALRQQLAMNAPGARVVVWSLWCRQHDVARTA